MTDATALADRLLDAQVAHLVAELTGPESARGIAVEVRAVLAGLADTRVDQLVDRDDVLATIAVVLDSVGSSPVGRDLLSGLASTLRDLPANAEHRLGDVVPRTTVEAVVDVIAGSDALRDEAQRRLGRSPVLANLAMRFVQALVGDAVQQNRERVEKVPGVKSLFGVGDFAARQARGLAPKQLENLVGGAADAGAQAAMDRVTRALVEVLDEDAVRRASLEVWDLHANDTVAGLRAYLADDEIEALAETGHDVWVGTHGSPWVRAVLAGVVDGFLARHGEQTVAEFLTAVGLDEDALVAEVERHAGRVVAELHAGGHVEAMLRARLAPFFRSDATLAILSQA